jgi:hypothetical protein
MISSPCKNCPKKDLPKKDCTKDCQLLKEIQNFQAAAEQGCVSSRLDYTEDIRYSIPHSLRRTSMSLHIT